MDASVQGTDVVVVGSGVAAMTAAIAAHDGGARVLMVERTSTIGGTTAVSGGGIWMPQNRHMAERGIDDSRDEALAYMNRLTAGRTPDDMLELYVDRGPDIVADVEERTPLRLAAMSWPDYHPEMDGAKTSGRMLEPELYDTKRLGRWAAALRRPPVLALPITLQEATVEWRPTYFPDRFDATEVQRRSADHQVACGQALIGALLEACLSRGIEPMLETRASEIAMGGDRVRGLIIERRGQRSEIPATSVVLASGGYEWNSQLRDRFLPGPLTHPHSPPANEGDGLVMAMDVGADLGNMNESWWYPAASVPGELYEDRPLARFVGVERTAPHSIIVDRFGSRFVNEAANYNDMQKAFFSFDANQYSTRHLPCWVVFDHQYRSKYPVVSIRPADPDPDWLAVDDTVEGLASKVGIDPVGLADTIGRWNRFVHDGRDRDFGRGDSAYDRFHGDPAAPHPNLGTIERGPYHALPIHVGTVGTKGGPRVDLHGRVMHVHDHPIPGLYGAGNVIASPAGPAYYGGGTSIGMGMVWGHLSGSHAASYSTAGVSVS